MAVPADYSYFNIVGYEYYSKLKLVPTTEITGRQQ